ncbi:MAG: DUF1579 family protein [Phycisphaerales bacterium]|nr:DUF1579 family protein [Phycisphaerales bacterium]
MCTKRFLPILIIASLSLCSFALYQEEVPGETLARMERLGEKFATPNEQHEFLQHFAGTWDTSTTYLDMGPSQGEATYTMLFGDRFLDGLHTGELAGVAFVSRLTLGYDNYKHKFVASFVDDLGTSIRQAEGILSHSKKSLSLWGTMDDWFTDEHDKHVLYRVTRLDNDHFTLNVFDLASSYETPIISTLYTRQ